MMQMSGRMDRKSGTILIIDDEEGVRSVTISLLARRGYDVLEASNGHEALQICSDVRKPIDLAIVDIVMPGLNGFEFVDRAKRIRSDFRVIFTSGHFNPSKYLNRSETLVSGQNFIPKPFSLNYLLHLVDNILGEQQ